MVEQPRWLWLPILYGVILTLRPRVSAAAYAKIWWPQGSPLLVIAERQAAALQAVLDGGDPPPGPRIQVALAMRYGRPALEQGLGKLRAAGCRQLLLLPLYPQYSATTTATTFDRVAHILRGWRRQPALRTVCDYHAEPGYIDALAQAVEQHWSQHGRGERLLLSFHGIPQRYADAGDPYPRQCAGTAEALARRLGLDDKAWQLCFQSRFGREPWLAPYTDKTLQAWGRAGLKSVDVLCPGFSADCLETLEEIAMTNRALFQASGGQDLRYIPALNDRADHIVFLANLVRRELGGWLD